MGKNLIYLQHTVYQYIMGGGKLFEKYLQMSEKKL